MRQILSRKARSLILHRDLCIDRIAAYSYGDHRPRRPVLGSIFKNIPQSLPGPARITGQGDILPFSLLSRKLNPLFLFVRKRPDGLHRTLHKLACRHLSDLKGQNPGIRSRQCEQRRTQLREPVRLAFHLLHRHADFLPCNPAQHKLAEHGERGEGRLELVGDIRHIPGKIFLLHPQAFPALPQRHHGLVYLILQKGEKILPSFQGYGIIALLHPSQILGQLSDSFTELSPLPV